MATAKYVSVGGVLYSPNHPVVKALHGIVPVKVKTAHVHYESATLNQTEQRFFEILKERFPHGFVQAHAIKLQLAEKCWYLPDFSYTLPTGALVFVETKGGFERDDAIVKLKCVARQFPQFTFVKAQFKNGKWKETVMPK